MSSSATTAATAFQTAIAGIDFSPIQDTVISAFTIALPICVVLIGLRKGISTLKGVICGA